MARWLGGVCLGEAAVFAELSDFGCGVSVVAYRTAVDHVHLTDEDGLAVAVAERIVSILQPLLELLHCFIIVVVESPVGVERCWIGMHARQCCL